jgi:HSP20 family protein
VEKRGDLERAAEQIEELFADLWQVFPFARGARRGYRPQIDVFRSDNPTALIVHVELPGVDPDDVKLIAGGRVLVIVGERKRPKDSGHYQHMEIEYGSFRREVVLADEVDPDRASAAYERGILRVTLPVAAKPEPRVSVSIEVRTTP